MRGPWRATLALALHIGFFALPTGLVLGLFAATALTLRSDVKQGAVMGLVAMVVTVVLVVVLRTITRAGDTPRGTPVEKSTQPRLWKMAEAISSACDAKVPDRIRITSDPEARIRQQTTLLGLRNRGYSLEIGLALLAGLTTSELHAVVAREISHLVGRGRITAITYRTSISIERTLATLPTGPTKWLFTGYARMHGALTAPSNRALELDAAASAVRVAGKRNAVTAVRKATGVQLGWRDYATEYLSMAKTVERTPNVLLGFRSFMDSPDRKPALAERAKHTITEQTSSDRARLPTPRETVEMMKRLSAREREQDDRPAFALLHNPRKAVPALEDQLMINGLGPRMQWPELARAAGAAEVARQAGELSAAIAQSSVETEPAIGGVLAASHRGEGQELINPVLDPGLDPEHIEQAVIDKLTELLGAAVVDALIVAGHAHHELNWSGPSVVMLRNGRPLDPDQLVRPAVEDPRLVPGLHKALVDLGVPLTHARPPTEEPEPQVAGLLSPITFARRRCELLVTDRGLLLLPTGHGPLRTTLNGALTRLRRAEDERLAELAATPANQLRARSDAQWVDSRDIAEGSLDQQQKGWSLRLELYLDEYAMSSVNIPSAARGAETTPVHLHGNDRTEQQGTPYDGLRTLLGSRVPLGPAKRSAGR